MTRLPWVVGVSGASGTPYARAVLGGLLDARLPVDVVVSRAARLTLLDEIKGRWPELPVMMVTAYGDEERRRIAGERGAAKFLAKPVDFEFLKQQLLQLSGASS